MWFKLLYGQNTVQNTALNVDINGHQKTHKKHKKNVLKQQQNSANKTCFLTSLAHMTKHSNPSSFDAHCCHMSPERQSARMSKITNDGLTQSGIGCFSCTDMATVGITGLTAHGYWISHCHSLQLGREISSMVFWLNGSILSLVVNLSEGTAGVWTIADNWHTSASLHQ